MAKNKFNAWQNVLFWAVISAAFIGPGTVATAASAGSSFGLQLLWALIFSVFGCIVVQEAASRITIASGLSLGKAISIVAGTQSWLRYFVSFAVIFGCAAYQAGNILGAVSGLSLFIELPRNAITLVIATIAALLLATNSTNRVSYYLGFIVAFMGFSFLIVAFYTPLTSADWLEASLPRIPSGSELMFLGLVGTTIVPYNLFLGSGISSGQTVGNMRRGLIPAIVLGGIFSAAVIIAGTVVESPFTFEKLFGVLQSTFGAGAGILFAIGLFAAGFTSCVTAPLAAGLTARMAAPDKSTGEKWYRYAWIGVWLTGTCLGLFQLKPVPVILLAQALNGLILPLVVYFLGIAVNHPALMPPLHRNTAIMNVLLVIVVGVSTFLGAGNLIKAAEGAFQTSWESVKLYVQAIVTLVVIVLFLIRIRKVRNMIDSTGG